MKGSAFLELEQPVLSIVVDTEEEFDWSAPFRREGHTTLFHKHQARLQRILDKHQAVPTYVIDYPVATCPASIAMFSDLHARGLAEIGVHCHPWVTPPFDERLSAANSYHGNLPPALEHAKIKISRDQIADRLGLNPTVFKAGRYGIGPQTIDTLIDLGFKADCSVVPYTSFQADGGPVFDDVPTQPFMIAGKGGFLEFPLSVGFVGAGGRFGPALAGLYDNAAARLLRVPGILSRLDLLRRVRVSPENVSLADARRLIRTRSRAGDRYFSVAFHSSCMVPGCTSYVRNDEELDRFLDWLDGLFAFFTGELEGRITTIDRLS